MKLWSKEVGKSNTIPIPPSVHEWVSKLFVTDLMEQKSSKNELILSQVETKYFEFRQLKEEIIKKKLAEEKRQNSMMRFFW